MISILRTYVDVCTCLDIHTQTTDKSRQYIMFKQQSPCMYIYVYDFAVENQTYVIAKTIHAGRERDQESATQNSIGSQDKQALCHHVSRVCSHPNKSCHTFERVMSHVETRRVPQGTKYPPKKSSEVVARIAIGTGGYSLITYVFSQCFVVKISYSCRQKVFLWKNGESKVWQCMYQCLWGPVQVPSIQ